MSRVLLIGRGPLPSPTVREVGFAQLRTRHFAQALQSAGLEVDILLIDDDLQPGLLHEATTRAGEADAVVSAGPHRPGALAVAAAGDRPLWIDIPGDPLAELQALARAPGPPLAPERIAAAQAATHAVLARADAVSVISDRQAHATFGRLSALGRDISEPVPCATIPIAFDFPLPRQPLRPIPKEGPIRLALSGAFAPWLDDQRLCQALAIALQQHDRLELHVTGGGVTGHYTAGWSRFQQWAEPFAPRVQLHGWVPHDHLVDILGACHVGLCLDRPGMEPILGGRTRVLLYAWMGLQVAASPTCEQVGELVAQDAAHALTGSPSALAATLQSLTECPPRDASPWLDAQASPHTIAAPLVAWARRPTRIASSASPEALLAAQVELLQSQLSAVHDSPTWRLLSQLHRRLRGLGS